MWQFPKCKKPPHPALNYRSNKNIIKFLFSNDVQNIRVNKNFIFITNDDLVNKKNFNLIENYLNLKAKLTYPEVINDDNNVISSDLLKKANDCYEKYLFLMKSLV